MLNFSSLRINHYVSITNLIFIAIKQSIFAYNRLQK